MPCVQQVLQSFLRTGIKWTSPGWTWPSWCAVVTSRICVWSLDHKVASYSSNMSRCLKSTFKALAMSAYFQNLCCLLCIRFVCHTLQVYEHRIRTIDMMHRTFILMIKTCKISLVCKLWWLPGTTCSVLFKRSTDDSSSRGKKNAISAGRVDPAEGLRSPNGDLWNLSNILTCIFLDQYPSTLAEVCVFQTFAIWRSKFGQFKKRLQPTSALDLNGSNRWSEAGLLYLSSSGTLFLSSKVFMIVRSLQIH